MNPLPENMDKECEKASETIKNGGSRTFDLDHSTTAY
jgi:hypothetical protein